MSPALAAEGLGIDLIRLSPGQHLICQYVLSLGVELIGGCIDPLEVSSIQRCALTAGSQFFFRQPLVNPIVGILADLVLHYFARMPSLLH